MLREVLALGPSIQGRQSQQLVIEIKHPKGGRYPDIEQILLEQLDQAEADQRSLVISFDKTSLQKVHQLDPQLSTGYLYSGLPIDMQKTKDELGVTFLEPQFKTVTPDYVHRAHKLGLKVNAWTVDEESDMKRVLQCQVDALTTNNTPQLRQVLDEVSHCPRA